LGLAAGGLMALNTAWGQGQGWVDGCDYATPYTFVTIAGTPGDPGNVNGTNGAALFNVPVGLTVDTNNNVYVVDAQAYTVRKLAPVGTNWVVTTIAGVNKVQGSSDGTNQGILFGQPTSIAEDGAGNLYVTDGFYNTVRKLTPIGTNWVSSTIAGTPDQNGGSRDGTNGVAQFNYPAGIAVDALGNVYVADTDNSTIRLVASVGTNWVVTTIAGTVNTTGGGFSDGTNQNAQFSVPAGLAIDRAGNIFVGDTGNDIVREIQPMGTNWVTTTIAGTPGNVISGAADGTNDVATFFSPFDPPFSFTPMAIAVDTSDNLYVADGGDGLIRMVSPEGTNWVTTTLAGLVTAPPSSANGTGTNALFGAPAGIAVNAAGKLFVGDIGEEDIREGSLDVVTVPNLAINRAGAGGETIWWLGAGYSLQTNASLATTNWGIYGGTVNSSGATNSVSVPSFSGNLFFRLSL